MLRHLNFFNEKSIAVNINITDTAELERQIEISIEPSDYLPGYEKSLKKTKTQVQMPGFRRGMVPVGLVKKMYGPQIIADELNRLVDSNLNAYFAENKIRIFANPIPESYLDDELTTEKTYTLKFSIGVQPEFSVAFPESEVKYKIQPEASTVENYLTDIRKRYFHGAYPEVSEAGDTIFAALKQVDAENNVVEGGATSFCSFNTTDIVKTDLQKEFVGVSKEHKTLVDVLDIYGDMEKAAAALQKVGNDLGEIGTKFELTVRSILREGLHEINQELFDHVYGEGTISSEEEFMNRIREEVAGGLETDSNNQFFRTVFEKTYASANFNLPAEFLKRWLKQNSKNEVKEEEFDEYFEGFLENMRRSLVLDKILETNNVTIEYADLVAEAENYVRGYFARYGIYEVDPATLKKQTSELLKNEQFQNQSIENIKNRMFADLAMQKVSKNEQEISFQDFEKLAKSEA